MHEQNYSDEFFKIIKDIYKNYEIPIKYIEPKKNYSKKILEVFLYITNIILSAFSLYMFLTSTNPIFMIGSALYLVGISNIILLKSHSKSTHIESLDFLPYSLMITFILLFGFKVLYVLTTEIS